MQATTKRYIDQGKQFDHVLPKATRIDTVVRSNAKLRDTLSLMHQMIHQTKEDTRRLAPMLKGNSLYQSCKNIWEFVYGHIQYKMDKTGIEQVRRPSRTWADRFTGVDCDCYTVFIGTILQNLGIPFEIRITKYGGRAHFQHVYPIVPTKQGHITIDCVADRFNYEVPYSEMKSFRTHKQIQTANGLSGVDGYDIQLEHLPQPTLPLWETHKQQHDLKRCCNTKRPIIPQQSRPQTTRGQTLSPYRFQHAKPHSKGNRKNTNFSTVELLLHTAISLGLGYGVYRLFTRKNTIKK